MIPVSIARDTLILPVSKIPTEEITSIVGNLCTFSCSHCDRADFPNWEAIAYHLRNSHKLRAAYKPCLVSTAQYHSCLICPTAVLSDRAVLQSHLRQRHHMNVAKY